MASPLMLIILLRNQVEGEFDLDSDHSLQWSS